MDLTLDQFVGNVEASDTVLYRYKKFSISDFPFKPKQYKLFLTFVNFYKNKI